MIFNNNTTVLGGSIPMAEGYDCSYGAALALVESARNDYEMFKGMLGIEARELQIRESGVMQESELVSLTEAAVSGIWNKIKELFAKLAAKVKAIFHTFVAKLSSLWKSDKEMVKKYSKEIIRKTNIGNLEVKWHKVKEDPFTKMASLKSDVVSKIDSKVDDSVAGLWDEDSDKRFEKVAKAISVPSDKDSFAEDLMDTLLEDEETLQIKEISGGMREICSFLEGANKKMQEIQKGANKITTACEKIVKAAEKNANDVAKDSRNESDDAKADAAVKAANHVYDVAVTYQDIVLKTSSGYIDAAKKVYQQNKAAFMKAIAANNDKLEESAVYLEAVEGCAYDEVDDVIDCAIASDGDEMMDSSNADSKLVGTKDYELGYQDDHDEYKKDTVDGTESSNYNRNESAIFGKMLY